AQVGGRAIGQHIALGDLVATLDDGTLVDVGVLVGTGVLDQVVDVDAHFAGDVFIVVDADNDTLGVDVVDHAATQRLHGSARVDRHSAFDAGAHHGLFRAQARHGLALHVGAHQRAVRVVVLEERNQRRRHRDDLRRSHVHVVHVGRRGQHGFASFAASHQVVDETAFVIERGV